jgi:hypothetical protein
MRLVTRSDFDGLVCAALLEELGVATEYLYAHPKDIQDGKVAITSNDVLANVPYVAGCGLWFDHHSSETERIHPEGKFTGAYEAAPSAARVIYNYYAKEPQHAAKLAKFTQMLAEVDKADSASYTREDILDPQGWMLLAFLSDPRTGMGYTHSYRISNFDLMKSLPGMLRTMTIDQILANPDVQERVKTYRADNEKYRVFLKEVVYVQGDAIVLDLRGKKELPTGNRFMEYTLFPAQNVSVRLVDGRNGQFVMLSVGASIINRTSRVDVGALMLKHGGGGHKKVGTCQVSPAKADEVLRDILQTINAKK